jgi:hypothetical protein
MRFLLSIVCVLSLVVVACGLNTVQCECPTIAPTVTFTITDAVTGVTIQDPVFSVNAASVNGQCIGVFADDAGPDAGPNCKQWQLSLPVGHSTVTVGASGYQTQTFGLDTTMSSGCCSTGTQLNQTVQLAH